MSFKTLFILSDLVKILLLAFLPSAIMNAPTVDGSETKSKQINWKSSCTRFLPELDLTEPKPLEEIPNLTPPLIRSFKILPEDRKSTRLNSSHT